MRDATRWQSWVQPVIAEFGEEKVAAVWVTGIEERHQYQLGNYLQQALELEARPDFRMRDLEGGLFIIGGQKIDLDHLQGLSERFGTVKRVFPELRLVEVAVDTSVVREASRELIRKLEDPSEGAFYTLNYNELAQIDKTRVEAAIRRLARAEPVRRRKDITARLALLLGEKHSAEVYGQIADALKIWSEEDDGVDEIVAEIGLEIFGEGKEVPSGIVEFLSARKTSSAAPFLVKLWEKNPSQMQGDLEKFGSALERFLWEYLENEEVSLQKAAVTLLGTIGTDASLSSLKKMVANTQNEELKSLAESTMGRIRG